MLSGGTPSWRAIEQTSQAVCGIGDQSFSRLARKGGPLVDPGKRVEQILKSTLEQYCQLAAARARALSCWRPTSRGLASPI
jgi:hypothetical protein